MPAAGLPFSRCMTRDRWSSVPGHCVAWSGGIPSGEGISSAPETPRHTFRPAVTGHDPEGQVREVGEDGGIGGDDDVGEQDVLAMYRSGAVHRGHDRHLQVDEPLHYPPALRSRLVPDRRLARVVQALPVDLGHEPVAGAGQYQYLVLPVIPDLVQGPRQIAVHLPGERCRTTFGLEPERQHACGRAGEGEVLERGEVCRPSHFHVGTPLAHEG
jgi:hypothetical protein